MIECIFTIDYEIYGNGEGSLKELVYEPAARLKEVFEKRNARFVPFIEVAELEIIEARKSDAAIELIKRQIRELYNDGFTPGLHLHPQWYNAQYRDGKWLLDYSEYNLCILPVERIVQIVHRSVMYLREVLQKSDFTPLAFRAGNWLFQPTEPASRVLAQLGIKVDSSVFKGGLNRQYGMDYRRALKNGYYWKFTDRADVSNPEGALLEFPIYTRMVPAWRMVTAKRVGLQRRRQFGAGGYSADEGKKKELLRLLDFLRFWYPRKFDFCRMTLDELTDMMDAVIREDQEDPASFRPIVAIGHTKDLVDLETVEAFLSYLELRGISVVTFEDVYRRCT